MTNATRIADYSFSNLGLQETFHETSLFPFVHVICDAITQDKNLEQKAKELTLKCIWQYIQKRIKEYTPKNFEEALLFANRELNKAFNHEESKVKVSALIIVDLGQEEGSLKKLLCIGIGDCKCFHVTKTEKKLLFSDPNVKLNASKLKIQDRFNCLTNTLGNKKGLEVNSITTLISPKGYILLATYGIYTNISEHDLNEIGEYAHKNSPSIIHQLTKLSSQKHAVHLIVSTQETPPQETVEQICTKTHEDPKQTSRFKKNLAYALALLLLGSLSVFSIKINLNPKLFIDSASLESDKTHIAFSQSIPKVPIKWAYPQEEIKDHERILATLQEQNETQKALIKKLSYKLRVQNRALRDMQVKLRDNETVWSARVNAFDKNKRSNSTERYNKV